LRASSVTFHLRPCMVHATHFRKPKHAETFTSYMCVCQTRHTIALNRSCLPTRSLRRHPAACRAHPVMLATPRPPCARLAAQNSSHVPSPPFAGAAAADCALSARRRVRHHDCLLPLVIKQPAAAEARPAAKFSTPSSCRIRAVSGRRLRRVLNANAVVCSSILDVLLK